MTSKSISISTTPSIMNKLSSDFQKEKKDVIKSAAQKNGVSVNNYIISLIDKDLNKAEE